MFTSLLLLLACGSDPTEEEVPVTGSAELCFGITAGEYTDDEDVQEWTAAGIAEDPDVFDFDLWPCVTADATQALQIEDDFQIDWQVGWVLLDPNGLDVSPGISVGLDESIDVLYRGRRAPSWASGFIAQGDQGLVAAAEAGDWPGVLADGEISGLTVEVGDVISEYTSDCGQVNHYAVRFSGDEDIVLEPGQSMTFTVDGWRATAFVFEAWEHQEASCDDPVGRLSWAVFRND